MSEWPRSQPPAQKQKHKVVPSDTKLTFDPGNQTEARSHPRIALPTAVHCVGRGCDGNWLSGGLFLRNPLHSLTHKTLVNGQSSTATRFVTSIAHSQHRTVGQDIMAAGQ